nr:MAG TPA: hypothetical protein [Bacteriophage sp.]
MNIGVAGQFELHVYDETGALREHRPMQPNLITDTGLITLMQGHFLAGVRLGSGDSEPQKTDTQLAAPLADITYASAGGDKGGQLYDNNNQYYTYCAPQYRARNTGTAAATVKELGLLDNETNKLATHALIKSGGVPAPVVLQPGWYLDVTYELRAYYHKAPVSKDVEFTVGGDKKTYHTRTVVWAKPDGKSLYAVPHPANFNSSSRYVRLAVHAYPGGLVGDKPPDTSGGAQVTEQAPRPQDADITIQGDAAVADLPVITMREETNVSGGKVKVIGLFGGALMSHAIEFKDDAGEGIPKDELSAIDFRFRYTVSRYTGTLEERA